MYFRLTPTLMFCVLLVAKLRPFLGAGPLWYLNADTSRCSDNWWTNLLYLNNFIPENRAEVRLKIYNTELQIIYLAVLESTVDVTLFWFGLVS